MQPALLIRLRPSGPWRFGPGDGALDGIDELYRSDRLFSAFTIAARRLGFLDEWIDATVRTDEPAVAFSSLFPFQGETLFAIPPSTVWPPPPAQVTAPNSVFLTKIRWKTARFVPLSVIDLLITGGRLLADQWIPDPESLCLLRRDRPSTSPFRTVTRRSAAVDRVSHMGSLPAASACVEFEPGSGLWTLARYRNAQAQESWSDRVEAVFRLLADSGFGGKRSSGWGHSQPPEFERGTWPGLLLPKLAGTSRNGSAPKDAVRDSARYWLLSVYSPSRGDQVDWRSGDYTVAVRTGRVESPVGGGAEKKAVRMISEGSVLVAASEPAGAAVDVAPDNFSHPVFRSGLALALELPLSAPQAAEEIQTELRPAEEPSTVEAAIESPCEESARTERLANPESEPVEPASAEAVAEPIGEEQPVAGPVYAPETEAAPESEIQPEAPPEPLQNPASEEPQELATPLEPHSASEIQPDPETQSEPPAPPADEPTSEPTLHSEEPGHEL